MLDLEFIRSLRLGWSWNWSKFLNRKKKLNRFLSRRKEFQKDETIRIQRAEDRCWAKIQTEIVGKAIKGSRELCGREGPFLETADGRLGWAFLSHSA